MGSLRNQIWFIIYGWKIVTFSVISGMIQGLVTKK